MKANRREKRAARSRRFLKAEYYKLEQAARSLARITQQRGW